MPDSSRHPLPKRRNRSSIIWSLKPTRLNQGLKCFIFHLSNPIFEYRSAGTDCADARRRIHRTRSCPASPAGTLAVPQIIRHRSAVALSLSPSDGSQNVGATRHLPSRQPINTSAVRSVVDWKDRARHKPACLRADRPDHRRRTTPRAHEWIAGLDALVEHQIAIFGLPCRHTPSIRRHGEDLAGVHEGVEGGLASLIVLSANGSSSGGAV